jgi:hypothetical protein
MSVVQPFDLQALRVAGLELIVVDVAAGTLELRFAHTTEIWQRVDAGAAAIRVAKYLRSFNGELYVGPREAA